MQPRQLTKLLHIRTWMQSPSASGLQHCLHLPAPLHDFFHHPLAICPRCIRMHFLDLVAASEWDCTTPRSCSCPWDTHNTVFEGFRSDWYFHSNSKPTRAHLVPKSKVLILQASHITWTWYCRAVPITRISEMSISVTKCVWAIFFFIVFEFFFVFIKFFSPFNQKFIFFDFPWREEYVNVKKNHLIWKQNH